MQRLLYLLILVSLIGLSGCASNASVAQMAYKQQIATNPHNLNLVKAITVRNVSGGHETNPLWTPQISNENFKQALVNSLQQANLYSETSSPRYVLTAELLMLDQPMLGIDITTSCQVRYSLLDTKRDKTIYQDTILTSHTTTMGEALVAVERFKKAVEGAAKANIQKLLQALYALP